MAQDTPIKLIHCISNFRVGGTELNAVRTLERLDRSKFDVRVIALNLDGPLRKRVEDAGIAIDVFDFSSHKARAVSFLRLVTRLRREAPDVVHCHDRYSNTFVVPCASLARVPLIISSRRWWTAMPNRFYGAGNRLAYRLSHRVIANSRAVGQLLEEEGVDPRRVVVLPNFVDESAFATLPGNSIAEARARFGIPSDALVVTLVAILRPEKNIQSVIEAIAQLNDRFPNVYLLIVGSGPCEEELRAAARASGLEHHVRFAGFHTSPPNPHGYGDLSVLASLHEGFPNSIVEAMAAGKAVVATNVGGVPDAVADGETGLLVAPNSSMDLADALGRLIADLELRDAMGRAGQDAARQAYGQDAVIGQLESLYGEVRR